jgi:metal-responsive CopG/Arc/MetJ family transcriptional regulator
MGRAKRQGVSLQERHIDKVRTLAAKYKVSKSEVIQQAIEQVTKLKNPRNRSEKMKDFWDDIKKKM